MFSNLTQVNDKVGYIQYINFTSPITDYNMPWLAIKDYYDNFTAGVMYVGHFINGSVWCFTGSKTDNKYGSFIVYSYNHSQTYRVYMIDGVWYYDTFNVTRTYF